MTRSRITFFAVLFLAVVFLATPPAFSQTITTGDIVGVVTDTSGAVVPGATVTLKSVDSGETRTDTTSSQGAYRFALLKPGEYIVSASTPGLKSNNVRTALQVGQEHELNITMNPLGTNTIVEVNAETSLVQTENANLETNYNSSQVVNLPMAGGDLTTLAMTVPGIRVSVVGGSGNMNANGIPGSSVLYTLNGTAEMDPYNNLNNSGASNNLLGANEVAEVAVVLNAYSAQYGQMAGGQVNIIGSSGTNQFHGNAFYNFNWQDLNANSFFNNAAGTPRGRSDAHNFGGKVGGPVIRNKLFFFFDDENLRYVLPGSGEISVPSPQLQSFTLAHVPAASLPLYQDYFGLVNGAPGLNRAVPVTNGGGLLQDSHNVMGCGTGTFPGTPTGIPNQTFGKSVNGSTAVPCALAFGTNTTELNTELLYTIRIDYNVSNNQKLFFRYNRDQGIQATGVSPINPLYNSVSVQPQSTGSVNYTYVITPTLVNSFVGSANYYIAQFGVANFAKSSATMPDAITLADGGCNGCATSPGGSTSGLISIGNGAYPNGRNIGHGELHDDLSWSKGRHTVKAGFGMKYDELNYTSIASGAFLGTYSLNDMTDFAYGQLNVLNPVTGKQANLGSSFSQSFPVYGALHFRLPAIAFYGSDEWAVTRNLKVTYGLRIEKGFNPTCNENCFSLLNQPFTSSGYQGGVSIPYDTTVKTGLSHNFYNLETLIAEPRLGIAWKPFKSDKTVIRGGIGLFSTNPTDSLAGTFSNQIPNKFSPSGINFGNIGVITDPTSSAFSAQASANAFFNGFKAGDTLAQLQTAVKPATFGVPSFSSLPSTFHAPKDIEWNFEIEHQVTAHNLFTLGYVGNHGYNLQETVNANAYMGAAGITMYGGSYAGLPLSAPDGRFLTVTQYYNNGVSNYDAMTIQFRHTFTYGLTAQIHYTWSHALGTIAYENPFNLSNGYGSLNFDNRHQVAGDFVWVQPFKAENKVMNQVISGWMLSSKLYLYSGAPFSVTDSKIPAQVNSAGGIITPIADVLNSSAPGANCGKFAVDNACLTTSEFATYKTSSGVGTPIQTDWGNVAPDSFRGPGYFDIDTQLTRDFRIKERARLTLGMQFYNILNHANFANPSGSLSSGSFGRITSVVGPPTSIYGSFQGASVSGRVAVLTGRFTF